MSTTTVEMFKAIYSDSELNKKHSGPTGSWGDTCDDAGDEKFGVNSNVQPSTLVYSTPTYTQFDNGQWYLGYPIGVPKFVNSDVAHVSKPFLSSSLSDTTWTELSTESYYDDLSDGLIEDNESVDGDLDSENTEIGTLEYYKGWTDASANWGVIRPSVSIMGYRTFLAPSVPLNCRRRGKVRFVITPNRRGKTKWVAEILEPL